MMRHSNPVIDHMLREEALERKEELAFYELKLENFLTEPLNLFGQLFEANMTATLTRSGLHGDIEVHSFECGDVYIQIPDHFDSLMLIDQVQLKSRHRDIYNAILFAGESEALRIASQSNDWLQEDLDE